jgi:hypothetical protein
MMYPNCVVSGTVRISARPGLAGSRGMYLRSKSIPSPPTLKIAPFCVIYI